MPNQKVKYFKPIEEINGKFVYVKDKDLIGFDSANSVVFQFNLQNMTKFGLSENFILIDDDYFFGKPVKKSDFFYYDEKLKKVVPAVLTDDFSEMVKSEVMNEYNKLWRRKNAIKPHAFNGWKISQLSAFKLLLEQYDMPFIFAGFGIFLMLLPVTEIGEGNFNIAAICGVIFFAIGIYLFFKLNNSVIFVMGPNTLTVIEKATCRKKTRIYNPGELQRIALDYRYIYRHSEGSGGTGGYMHEYSLIVFRTTEGAANIFSVSSSSPEFTSEEIDYFLYYINTHIQTKMMA
jgi:hypothetical protein